MQLTELLYGEEFVVRADGNSDHWLLGSARADAVEGYVERPALQPASGSATHRVARKYITVFNQPMLTATTKLLLPLNALLRVNGNRDTIHYANGAPGTEAAELSDGGWVATSAVLSVDQHLSQWTEVASLLVGAPYVWGGKSWLGCDGAGLIFTALAACGIRIPRLPGQQVEYFRRHGKSTNPQARQSGRTVVIAGASGGFVLPSNEVIVASTTEMQVVRTPLENFLAAHPSEDCLAFELPDAAGPA